MADKPLALYTGLNSTFNLEEIPQLSILAPKNTFVREEARVVMMALLAIMPPLLSGASGGTSVQSTTRTKAPQDGAQPRWAPLSKSALGTDSFKRKIPESVTKSVHVMPLGNTIYSHSYTVVGVQKPDGRSGKGLMRKPGKGKGPTIPVEKCVSKETAGS